jgi:hypothetical protein
MASECPEQFIKNAYIQLVNDIEGEQFIVRFPRKWE